MGVIALPDVSKKDKNNSNIISKLVEMFNEKSNENLAFTVGTQRYIHIQDKKNKRRRQRSKKKTPAPVLSRIERVFSIFKTGRLIDRVHYKEVDPYWGTLWRQYELVKYLEVYIKETLKRLESEKLVGEKKLRELKVKLKNVIEGRKEFVHYLCNSFYIQMGGVINTRYYGWEELYSQFLAKFQETGIELVKRLQFNPDKTRCSVYFYQAFWLVGLQVIDEAKNKEDVEIPISADPNRGRKIFSEDFEDGDIDNIDFISPFVENSGTIEDELSLFGEDVEIEELKEEGIEISNEEDEKIEMNTGTEDLLIEDKVVSEDGIENESFSGKLSFLDQYLEKGITIEEIKNIRAEMTESQEIELTSEAVAVVRRLLQELNLPSDLLYVNNKFFSKFKRELKKAVKNGKINLSNKDKLILSLYLGKPIIT